MCQIIKNHERCSMKLDKLTVKSQELLQTAHDMAQKYGNQAIEPVHFLKAMVED
ncbi:MAG: hypothetical protein KJ668_13245, partial [Proteobacteria bacterium]|nr:hypothetical protein [Pseudomonadota bacterium]